MTVTKEQLKSFVENNPTLVTLKESKRYPGLFVLKYKRCVFYDSSWTPELELCRGTVVDKDFNLVIRPFTKIYNRGERGTDIDRDSPVIAVRKVNGFMGAVTYVPGHGCVVSSTGSLDSDYVDLATTHVAPFFEYIEKVYHQCGGAHTWLFEICDKTDPHIIEEEPGAYLLGAQVVKFEDIYIPQITVDSHADFMKAKRPLWKICRFSDLVEEVKTVEHEGFVVYSQKTVLKMKSPYYLTLKAIARANFDNIVKGHKERLDEEYYPLVNYLQTVDGFADMEEQEKLNVIREFLAKGQ